MKKGTEGLLGWSWLLSAVMLLSGCKHGRSGTATDSVETTVSLDGMTVGLALPGDFRRTKDSDERLAMVSFDRERDHPVTGAPKQTCSVTLVGTSNVRVPPSLEDAIGLTRGDFCQGDKSKCTVLAREALAGGGFLVTVKDFHAVTVETVRPARNGRAFVCEAYAACPFAKDKPDAWLDDPSEVKAAQTYVEAICRSAHAL